MLEVQIELDVKLEVELMVKEELEIDVEEKGELVLKSILLHIGLPINSLQTFYHTNQLANPALKPSYLTLGAITQQPHELSDNLQEIVLNTRSSARM